MLPRRFIPGLLPIIILLFLLTLWTGTAVQAAQNNTPTREEQVLELLNIARWQNGRLPPLKGNSRLSQAALTHSQQMAERNFFDHCDFETGLEFWQRMEAAGYTDWDDAGENIAAGFDTAAGVMEAWMNSPGHRSNILSAKFREVGIGFVKATTDEANIRESDDRDCRADTRANGPYFNYWTQDFGHRNDVMPLIINREAYKTNRSVVALYLYGEEWAQSMRFRNEQGSWSPWRPFSTNSSWVLSHGNGLKVVYVEISNGPNGAGLVRTNTDTIILERPVSSSSLPLPEHQTYLPLLIKP